MKVDVVRTVYAVYIINIINVINIINIINTINRIDTIYWEKELTIAPKFVTLNMMNYVL